MERIQFRASIASLNAQAPPQKGFPSAKVTLAGALDDTIYAALYSWADGEPVNVVITREPPEGVQTDLWSGDPQAAPVPETGSTVMSADQVRELVEAEDAVEEGPVA